MFGITGAVSLCILLSGAIYGILACILPERRRQKKFHDREDIELHVIHENGFNDVPFESFQGAWCAAAAALGVPPLKAAVTDRFDVELAADPLFPFVELNERFWTHIKKLETESGLRSHFRDLGGAVRFIIEAQGITRKTN